MTENNPIPFEIFESKYPWPNVKQLRKYYFYREDNGLDKAFVKFGGRVLVKPKTFFDIVEGKEDAQDANAARKVIKDVEEGKEEIMSWEK